VHLTFVDIISGDIIRFVVGSVFQSFVETRSKPPIAIIDSSCTSGTFMLETYNLNFTARQLIRQSA